jgi:hypothetical protein
MAVKIIGSSSGNVLEVDSNNNLKANLPIPVAQAGFAALAAEYDSGTVVAGTTRTVRGIASTPEQRLKVGMDTPMFNEYFQNTTVNCQVWNTPQTTSTVTQGSGYLTLNAGANLTAAQGAIIRSYRTFPIYNKALTVVEMLVQLNVATGFNNSIAEWGASAIGTASGTASVDGALFRFTSSGLSCLIVNNTTELTETTVDPTRLAAAGVVLTNTNHFFILFDEDWVSFFVSASGKYPVLLVEIPRPAQGIAPTMAMQVPIFARQHNTGTNTGTALKINIAMAAVYQGDIAMGKPWSHVMAGAGATSLAKYSGAGTGMTAAWNNWTTLPAQTTAVTVTAIGTGATAGLGGINRVGNGAGTIALSADSAYIIFNYLNPALTVAQPLVPAKNLYITGMSITGMTRGATGPATLTSCIVGANVGHFQANPATADSPTTPAKQGRIDALGQMVIPASAPVGTSLGVVSYLPFGTPYVVQPGEYISIWFSVGVAYTIAASQELVFTWHVDGYWE